MADQGVLVRHSFLQKIPEGEDHTKAALQYSALHPRATQWNCPPSARDGRNGSGRWPEWLRQRDPQCRARLPHGNDHRLPPERRHIGVVRLTSGTERAGGERSFPDATPIIPRSVCGALALPSRGGRERCREIVLLAECRNVLQSTTATAKSKRADWLGTRIKPDHDLVKAAERWL